MDPKAATRLCLMLEYPKAEIVTMLQVEYRLSPDEAEALIARLAN